MNKFKPYLLYLERLSKIGFDREEILSDPNGFFEEMGPSLKVLEDRSLDPGDLQTISDFFWKKFKDQKIMDLKQAYRLHRQLMPLYELMENASEEDWQALAKIVHEYTFQAQAPLFQILTSTQSDINQDLDDSGGLSRVVT